MKMLHYLRNKRSAQKSVQDAGSNVLKVHMKRSSEQIQIHTGINQLRFKQQENNSFF